MSVKSIGAGTALAFAAECVNRGGTVCEAYGDDAPYDFIVDAGGSLFKVQVKGSSLTKKGTYQANTWRRKLVPKAKGTGFTSKAVPYAQGEIDVLAAQFFGHWCLWADPHLLPATIGFRPGSVKVGKKYAYGYGQWHLIGLP